MCLTLNLDQTELYMPSMIDKREMEIGVATQGIEEGGQGPTFYSI